MLCGVGFEFVGVNLNCSVVFWYLGGDFPYMMVTFGVLLVLDLWIVVLCYVGVLLVCYRLRDWAYCSGMRLVGG